MSSHDDAVHPLPAEGQHNATMGHHAGTVSEHSSDHHDRCACQPAWLGWHSEEGVVNAILLLGIDGVAFDRSL